MRLKLIPIFISLLCIASIAKAQTTGYTTVSGSKLHDATGTLIASATIRFQPVNNNGVPISFLAGGAGGQTVAYPVSTTVTNGGFSIILADTTLTSPVNVCYSVTLTSNTTGSAIPFPGYSCIQPSGATWSFDTFTPNLAPLVVETIGSGSGSTGPTGATGATGAAGAAATVTIGTTTTLSAGASATVTNVGTSSAAVFNFGIPQGAAGSGSGGGMTYPSGTGIATVAAAAWGTTLAAPASAIVGVSDTQTLVNKTVDGVAPAAFAFLDATSSIQAQLNSKASSFAGLSGTATATQLPAATSTTQGAVILPASASSNTLGTASTLSAPYVNSFAGFTITNYLTSVTSALVTSDSSTFSDSTVFIRAAPAYNNVYAADFTLTDLAQPSLIATSMVLNVITKLLANTNVNGEIPIALSSALVPYYYSGEDSYEHHATPDGAFAVPILEQDYYNRLVAAGTASGTAITEFTTDAPKLAAALNVLAIDSTTGCPKIVAGDERSSWGFQDGVRFTGAVAIDCVFYAHAAQTLAKLYGIAGNTAQQAVWQANYTSSVAGLSTSSALWDSAAGMLWASSGQNSTNINIYASVLAAHWGLLSAAQSAAVSTWVGANYASITYDGYIRQSPTDWALTGVITSSGGAPYGNDPTHPGTNSKGMGTYDDGYWTHFYREFMESLVASNPAEATKLAAAQYGTPDPTQEFIAQTGLSISPAVGNTGNLESPMGPGAAMQEFPGLNNSLAGSGNYVNLCSVVTLSSGATCSNGMISIASGTASVTISGIPGNYVNLVLKISGSAASSANIFMQFNGNSSAYYDYQQASFSGSSAYVGYTGTDLTSAPIAAIGNVGSSSTITIPFYSQTMTKMAQSSSGLWTNTGVASNLFTATWDTTPPITSITLFPNGVNWGADVMTIYGTN